MSNTEVSTVMSKKVVAHDVVTIRAATGRENAPIIISIPKAIANAAKVKLHDKVHIFTDGEIIYLTKLEEPKISSS
jgi:hypothetical protein